MMNDLMLAIEPPVDEEIGASALVWDGLEIARCEPRVAHRIATCVNACCELPTEHLENGLIQQMAGFFVDNAYDLNMEGRMHFFQCRECGGTGDRYTSLQIQEIEPQADVEHEDGCIIPQLEDEDEW